jgi:V/A-type H+/Na+-transporting ATPase subunit A
VKTHSTSSPKETSGKVKGSVIEVRESLVTIEVADGAIKKNEVGYICVGEERLKAEVLRIRGKTADMQVFEDTSGVKVGDVVEMSGLMLSVVLGPGMLGHVFDGLENPLAVIAEKYGFFLPRGRDIYPLDTKKKWAFTPTVSVGAKLTAGQAVGTTPEGNYTHKIMVPFHIKGEVEVASINKGNFSVDEKVATLRTADGTEIGLAMAQPWPVRRPIPQNMLQARTAELSRRICCRRVPPSGCIRPSR